MIDSFRFGSIVIDGRTYRSDVLIFPDGLVRDGWWRGKGHRLDPKDIQLLIEANPEIIVAGTGVSGMMRPTPDLETFLSAQGIRFVAAPNKEATHHFNDNIDQYRTAGCFHLTC
jgi:hypothetical protein